MLTRPPWMAASATDVPPLANRHIHILFKTVVQRFKSYALWRLDLAAELDNVPPEKVRHIEYWNTYLRGKTWPM